MFILMLLVYKGFLPPPLVCSAPGAESNSAGGAETKTGGAEKIFAPFGRNSAPLIFFLPPPKFFFDHTTIVKSAVRRH